MRNSVVYVSLVLVLATCAFEPEMTPVLGRPIHEMLGRPSDIRAFQNYDCDQIHQAVQFVSSKAKIRRDYIDSDPSGIKIAAAIVLCAGGGCPLWGDNRGTDSDDDDIYLRYLEFQIEALQQEAVIKGCDDRDPTTQNRGAPSTVEMHK